MVNRRRLSRMPPLCLAGGAVPVGVWLGNRRSPRNSDSSEVDRWVGPGSTSPGRGRRESDGRFAAPGPRGIRPRGAARHPAAWQVPDPRRAAGHRPATRPQPDRPFLRLRQDPQERCENQSGSARSSTWASRPSPRALRSLWRSSNVPSSNTWASTRSGWIRDCSAGCHQISSAARGRGSRAAPPDCRERAAGKSAGVQAEGHDDEDTGGSHSSSPLSWLMESASEAAGPRLSWGWRNRIRRSWPSSSSDSSEADRRVKPA
jgi:hypothetical protein